MLSLKDKTSAVIDWAKEWDGFKGYLKLNAIVASESESTLVTDAVDTSLSVFIDGTAERVYAFNIRMVLPWSRGFDSTNEESMAFAVQLYDWIAEREARHEYPDWKGARISSLALTQSMPAVNFVYEEDELAEYIINCSIYYEE